jgi:hypothetical protein
MNKDNEDFNFDLSKYADAMDQEKLAELWAKVEVAQMLIDQSQKLTKQVYDDIEFFRMASKFNRFEEDKND